MKSSKPEVSHSIQQEVYYSYCSFRLSPKQDVLQAVAQGACHSLEGVKIEEVSLRAGDAILLIEGKLLTPDQNTTILLTDFPIALLQPLFKSVPALQHAAPAAGG